MLTGGENIKKIKEKPSVTKKAKEKVVAAPKELLRRGFLTGTEKLQGQLRDASQGGRQEETEADRAQNTARNAAWETAFRLEKLVHGKKKVRTGKLNANIDVDGTAPNFSTPDLQSRQGDPPGNLEPVQIKTKDAARHFSARQIQTDQTRFEASQIKTKDTARRFSLADHGHTDPARFESPQIKTKDACIQYQTTSPEYDPAKKNPSHRSIRRLAPHSEAAKARYRNVQRRFLCGKRRITVYQGI